MRVPHNTVCNYSIFFYTITSKRYYSEDNFSPCNNYKYYLVFIYKKRLNKAISSNGT